MLFVEGHPYERNSLGDGDIRRLSIASIILVRFESQSTSHQVSNPSQGTAREVKHVPNVELVKDFHHLSRES